MFSFCCCNNCIICYSDDFNRANDDIAVDAPLEWITLAGEFNVVSNQCKTFSQGGFVLLNKEIDLGPTQEYIVRVKIENVEVGDEAVVAAAFRSETDFFYATYKPLGGSAELGLYWADPGADIELNTQIIDEIDTLDQPAYFQITCNLQDFLIEASTIDANGDKQTCVGPYIFNGGQHCGFGTRSVNTVAIHSITVDDFSLCENQCLTGCVIDVDIYNRANSNDLGDDWTDLGAGEDDIQILSGYMYFQDSATAMHNTPHPDGHTTMGVAARVVFETLPPFANIRPSGTMSIIVGADDPADPQTYVRVEFNASTGTTTIWGVLDGGSPTSLDTGPNGSPSVGLREDDYYVCVDQFGKVRAYGKNWNANQFLGVAEANAGLYLAGPYCGLYGVGSSTNRVWIEDFIFIKTFHEGQPQQQRFTVGGTVEADDVFNIEISRLGENEGTIDLPDITEDVDIVTGETSIPLVVTKIIEELYALGFDTYPVIRSMRWFVDPDDPNSFIGEHQSNFEATATTTEDGGGAADAQTFSTEQIQAWEKGAYNCPRCKPICEPCIYCEGPLEEPPYENAPNAVLLIIEGTRHLDEPGFQVGCWDNTAAFESPYGPPFVNVPEDHVCHNKLDVFPPQQDYSSHCVSYDGAYILEGCGCNYFYRFPTWYEHYYPNPDCEGPPGIYYPPAYDSCNEDPWQMSCYPGAFCDGYWYFAAPVQGTIGGPNEGLLRWVCRLQDSVYNVAFWTSEWFPADECKYPRTCEYNDTDYTPDGQGCFHPSIQLYPIG